MLCRNVAALAVVGCFILFFLGKIDGNHVWVGYRGAGSVVWLGSLLVYLIVGGIVISSV